MDDKALLELEAVIDGKLQRVEIPQYSLKYPSYERVPLAAVKTGIYHPSPSTFFKYQHDDFTSKLSLENSRLSTNFTNDKFLNVNRPEFIDTTTPPISYPIRLVGDIEKSAKAAFLSNQELNFQRQLDLARNDQKTTTTTTPFAKQTSCVSGREFEHVNNKDVKLKPQFRFNRIRMVPDDRPTQGRLPSHLNTVPGMDSLGPKTESRFASNYRVNDGLRYTNSFTKTDPFKPYGNTSSVYNNYIMNYPRF